LISSGTCTQWSAFSVSVFWVFCSGGWSAVDCVAAVVVVTGVVVLFLGVVVVPPDGSSLPQAVKVSTIAITSKIAVIFLIFFFSCLVIIFG
jgi:hypothetical protein